MGILRATSNDYAWNPPQALKGVCGIFVQQKTGPQAGTGETSVEQQDLLGEIAAS